MIQEHTNEPETTEEAEGVAEPSSKRQRVERETADFFGDLFTRTPCTPVVDELSTYLTSQG